LATVADNLLQIDSLHRSQFSTSLEILETLGLGLTVTGMVATAGLGWGALTWVVGVLIVWSSAFRLLSANGTFVSPLSAVLAASAAMAVMTLAKFVLERERADTAGQEKTTAERLMVQSLLSLTETRDRETGRHSRRTQRYARLVAEQLATFPEFREYLTPERIELISSLAPLHDIGKVGIPDHILSKPGPLTPEEQAEMRKHPTLGRDVIERAEERVGVRDDVVLNMAKDIVYTHHERWDGTGYPKGLRGSEIPVAGRLMALVDVYDAAVTRTLYQPSKSHDEALRFIISKRGTHFDPLVVDAFVSVAPSLKEISTSGHLVI
jgi:response regulator RpfG family c-di-GMP phosphodiesterase